MWCAHVLPYQTHFTKKGKKLFNTVYSVILFLATTNSRLRNILYRTYTHWKLFAINLHYTGNDFWLWFYFISHFWFAIKYTYILFMQWKNWEKKPTLIGFNCAFSLKSFSFILLSTKLEREFSPKISHIIHFMIWIQFCGILCV